MGIKRISLDTNSYSNYFRGDEKVTKEIKQADSIYLSVVTLGELYLGFREGSKQKENIDELEIFLSSKKTILAPIYQSTSYLYSKLKYLLRKAGTPIPDNDIWIAACAMETSSTLISYDPHFLEIPKLRVWKELKMMRKK